MLLFFASLRENIIWTDLRFCRFSNLIDPVLLWSCLRLLLENSVWKNQQLLEFLYCRDLSFFCRSQSRDRRPCWKIHQKRIQSQTCLSLRKCHTASTDSILVSNALPFAVRFIRGRLVLQNNPEYFEPIRRENTTLPPTTKNHHHEFQSSRGARVLWNAGKIRKSHFQSKVERESRAASVALEFNAFLLL